MPLCNKGRNVRSKIRRFTKFCNSHYISRFAAFFIGARAKRSFVESFKFVCFSDSAANPHKYDAEAPKQAFCSHRKVSLDAEGANFVMIPPQVHLRRPCYDFYFL